MKERAVLFSTLTLLITVALFVWLTSARWGVVGIAPALRWLVLGSALFALALASLFTLMKRRTARARRHPAPAPSPACQTTPVETPLEQEPESKLTAVE